jgi:hypothetical protein
MKATCGGDATGTESGLHRPTQSFNQPTPMLRKKIAWTAPHTPAECCELLKPWTDTSLMKFGRQPFAGKLTSSKLVLWKRLQYNNGFQTVLEAKMLSTPMQKETEIVGHIGLRRIVIYFVAACICLLLLATVLLSIPAIVNYLSGHHYSVNNKIWPFLIPPTMILGILSMVSVGRWIARKEEAEITNLLRRTIQAAPSPTIKSEAATSAWIP